MDEHYVLAAGRYIEQNPERAKLVKEAWEYLWSSARAHVEGEDDCLVKVRPLLAMVGNWEIFLGREATADEVKQLRQHERTGRPLGNAQFIRQLEQLTGRMLRKLKPGPRGAGKVKNK
jgi:putative transposase